MVSLMLLMGSMMAVAQTGTSGFDETKKPQTINLKNGTTVTFGNASDIDSSRIVFPYNTAAANKTDDNWIGIKVYVKGKGEQDYLKSQIADIAFFGGSTETPVTDETNANKNDTAKNQYAYRLEFPRLYSGSDDTYEVTHTLSSASYPLNINYSIEWDGTKKANRWSCYFFCTGNKESNTSRSDAFGTDPDLPTSVQHTLADYSGSGFSRGHLCPSGDRLVSAEANKQTFYLTNMQPQWQNHNGVLWNNLEQQVRAWAAADGCDTLYVVKGATIDNSDQIYTAAEAQQIKSGSSFPGIIPKYFYMAVLSYNKSTNTYHAIGLWTEHNNTSVTNKNYGDYAITIDELEQKTGIDFFCNLPDTIENDVESKLDLTFWNITKSN